MKDRARKMKPGARKMTKELYLLVHDYDGLCGKMYPVDNAELCFSHGDLVLEFKTLSDGEHFCDLLGNESDRHFGKIIDQLFSGCAIDKCITRDICRYDFSYTIVPNDKFPIPEEDGVLTWNFYNYGVFGSSLISLSDYLDYEYREYYDDFYVFDEYIQKLKRALERHKIQADAIAAMGHDKTLAAKAISQLSEVLK